MLAASSASQLAPTFQRSTSATFPYALQQQEQQQQYQPSISNTAAMHGNGGFAQSRVQMSSSSSSNRVNGLPYQGGAYQNGNNAIMSNNGNNLVGSIPNSASNSTILAQPAINNLRRNRRPDTEEIKRVGRAHYQELFVFLRSHLAKGQRGPRTNAREKLTRLSQQQFTELSTDVYDELMRRINNARAGTEMPHLAVREEFHPKRNQARQKLATLPKNRFKDLSSDVFFELERRFPYLRDEYRPEVGERERREEVEAHDRSRAEDDTRQDSGQSSEMMDKEGGGGSRFNTASQSAATIVSLGHGAAASTSDVVIPAKSTLVEEEIAVPYAPPSNQSDEGKDWRVSGEGQGMTSTRDSILTGTDQDPSRNTMYSQASSIGTGFFNGYANSRATESVASPFLVQDGAFGASTFGIEKLRSDYEFRIATLQQKVTALESRNAEYESEKAAQEEEMERRLEEQSRSHDEKMGSLAREVEVHRNNHEDAQNQLKQTLSKLSLLQSEHEESRQEQNQRSALESSRGEEEFETLQKEYNEQEEVVTELKGEVTNLIEELRQLSLRNDEILSDKDNDQTIIRDLNNQVASYKRKYENAKTGLRNLKATSQLFVQPPKADDFMPASEEGVIADLNLTAFQSSIDELVAAARSKTPSKVLLAMKTVVLATTLINDDVAKYEQQKESPSPETKEQLTNIKGRISNTLNNLMTACRNHASSHGMSPVSLLDAAASHVSTSIVDLVKLLKVRKATTAEAEEFEATFTQNGTLPNGLKPLHTNILNSSHMTPPSFSPKSKEFRRHGSDGKNSSDMQENRLGPNSGGASTNGGVEGRFSPRIKQGSTMGRYSPVGYHTDMTRKTSNGTGSWKTNDGDATRKTSMSSQSSRAPVAAHLQDGTPSLSGTSSAPRSPNTYNEDSSFESSGKTESVLASLRASMALNTPNMSLLGGGGGGGGGLGGGAGIGREDSSEENWVELRNYIEVQTEAIVHSIQALLSSIREGAQGNQLNENLTQITTIVSSIIAISNDNIPKSSTSGFNGASSPLSADLDGEKILRELSDNCEKLIEMQIIGKFDKVTKSNMASASYGVAKGLKALSGLLNSEER
ncbi:hypothetical protein CBS101457_005613 [Exobasidium rhododendri]|nr:hypothetical protein CBS101457_005613 [Exobasidium rhododendri]